MFNLVFFFFFFWFNLDDNKELHDSDDIFHGEKKIVPMSDPVTVSVNHKFEEEVITFHFCMLLHYHCLLLIPIITSLSFNVCITFRDHQSELPRFMNPAPPPLKLTCLSRILIRHSDKQIGLFLRWKQSYV